MVAKNPLWIGIVKENSSFHTKFWSRLMPFLRHLHGSVSSRAHVSLQESHVIHTLPLPSPPLSSILITHTKHKNKQTDRQTHPHIIKQQLNKLITTMATSRHTHIHKHTYSWTTTPIPDAPPIHLPMWRERESRIMC